MMLMVIKCICKAMINHYHCIEILVDLLLLWLIGSNIFVVVLCWYYWYLSYLNNHWHFVVIVLSTAMLCRSVCRVLYCCPFREMVRRHYLVLMMISCLLYCVGGGLLLLANDSLIFRGEQLFIHRASSVVAGLLMESMNRPNTRL